jgi:aerobic carbon-monoxide dehydrogenase medium subunit
LKPAPFEHVAPRSIAEAVSLLEQHGDEAKPLAGGQSLIPLLALRLATPGVLVDLARVEELDYVRAEGPSLAIGAMTTHRAVEKHASVGRCPMLVEALDVVGHVAIRNRGTVGGSLAHADPAAEWPARALALDAEVDAAGPGGTRTIPAAELFFTYLTTVLEPDELVTQIRLKLPEGRSGSAFVELARRHGDFAIAGAGAVVWLDDADIVSDARVVLIGVGPTALRSAEAEEALRGLRADQVSAEEVGTQVVASIDPVGDIHGSAGYRREVAKVLTERAVRLALDRARGGAQT